MSNFIYNKLSGIAYFNTLFKIIPLLSPEQKRKAIGVVFMSFLNGLLDVLGVAVILPLIYLIDDPSPIYENSLLKYLYNALNFKETNNFLFFLIIMVFVIFLMKNSLAVLLSYKLESFSGYLEKELIDREFQKYLNKDYETLNEANTTKTVLEIIKIPTEFSRFVVSHLVQATVEFFVITLIILFIVIYKPILVLLLGVSMLPVSWLLNYFSSQKAKEYGDTRNKIQFRTYRQITEAIYAYVDIKLNGKESFFRQRSRKALDTYIKVFTRLRVLVSLPLRIIETTSIIGIAVLYYYVAFVSESPKELVPILILFATASYRLLPSLNRFMASIASMRSYQHVFTTLTPFEKETYISSARLDTGEIHFRKTLEIKNLTFRYKEKNKNALNNINLKIEKGQAIGIVGGSGSGKTTFGKILLRLLEEQEGGVYVDGIQITSVNKLSWRKVVGYVPQDFYIMDATLAENIAFGLPLEQIDLEKLNNIIKRVQLEDTVNALEKGIYTEVGEFGASLSGGQRQRVAIARALYKDAELLVFDEATSALDNYTEEEIMKTLYELSHKDLTIIVIAHRTTTLKNCDYIYEFSNGNLIGKYTYNELMQRSSNAKL